MSAMANTASIVTTVMKPATNPGREKTPRDADATPRASIQEFCEEYYEDILPIIMDKIRRDKRKEIHDRLDFGEGSKERRIKKVLTTQVPEPCPRDRTGQLPGIVLAIEAALTGETLLMEIVLKVETAPVPSGSHMIAPILLSRQLPNLHVLSKTRSNNLSTTSSPYLNQF
uniref:Reverse transcriptase domain-containing protein n=1 Tax=Tanacetum cinerariifolium TaxID=118510 RepID=A0A699JQL8_TANCI|nr:hypothetical protein [Tanacetum cinerariifolium]